MFPKIVVPPNHPILIGCSIINHPVWGTTIFGNSHIGISYRGTLVRGMTLAAPKKNTANENPIGGSTGDQIASKMGHEAAGFGYGGMEFLVFVDEINL